MAFKVVFLAHAPDESLRSIGVCKTFAKEEGVHSILFCPGFTHRDVAEISEAVGENVGVFVARGDGPSNRVSTMIRKREGFTD